MGDPRYIVITLEDAKTIATALKSRLTLQSADVTRIVDRFSNETGADLAEMVATLKKLPICAACSIEGQADYCSAIEAQKQGRRLLRLLDRAAPT